MADPNEIGCEEALRRLAEFIDQELDGGARDGVERHLQTCRSCFSRMEFESRLKRQLTELSRGDAPAAATDRVRKLIKGF